MVVMMMMKTQVHSRPSSLVSLLTYSPRRAIRASRDHVRAGNLKIHIPSGSSSSSLCSCGRRHLLGTASPRKPILPTHSPHAARSKDVSGTFQSQRPDWYKELFAWFLSTGMRSYEAEIAGYKRKLFNNLTAKAEKVLEIGVGTGPNLKYYASNENVCVFGMDPNQKMEKYACESARETGLKPETFRFMQGVGEAIPLDDGSVDAVVGTLVLCSVSDVTQTLDEIKRVLKPGGIFLFIEHVAAEDGTFFRNVQNVLDPVQQVVADGCHLTRNTGLYISGAGFGGGAEINTAAIYSFPWIIRPHVYGVAYK
ncbi:S-adenosyl-L-methionine-dependent methyltransferases superfamily protein [Raphanus sativus]|nr:S-adenosyl-L-methionine-dependent methyltransferases superfamily protein [Raphanus sativus]